MSEIIHPLELETTVHSGKPPCSCKGPNAPWEDTIGKIKKIINNHSGIWYFLSSGSTVKSDWVKKVVDSK